MSTLTQWLEGHGAIVFNKERLPALCDLQYTFTNGREGPIQEAESIWGSVRPKDPMSQELGAQIVAAKGLLFEVHDPKLTFQFSFLDEHGGIVFEKWMA